MFRRLFATALLLAPFVLGLTVMPRRARAGVVNPDISVIGQPFMRWTDDPSDTSPKRVTFGAGEVEMVFDAYLNPYAKGMFITALSENGLELEEGFFTLVRGLPAGLQLKGGKYRVGFGKMNQVHPHALPFAERPRVLATYLPGDESLDEVGLSLSGRIPTPGTFSLTAAADWLQGDTFHDTAEARPAFVGNLSGFGMVGERSGYELSLSAAGGTNNVAADTRTRIYDAAGKLKLWTGASSYLLVQGELLKLDRENAELDSTATAYTTTRVRPMGGYAYADYNFSPRFDAGVLYERFQQPADLSSHDQSVGAFVGYSLMEETTAFRLDWNRFMPGTPSGGPSAAPAVNTLTLRAIFSMGPHKAHQF